MGPLVMLYWQAGQVMPDTGSSGQAWGVTAYRLRVQPQLTVKQFLFLFYKTDAVLPH